MFRLYRIYRLSIRTTPAWRDERNMSEAPVEGLRVVGRRFGGRDSFVTRGTGRIC